LILSPLVLRPALLFGNTPLLFKLALLILALLAKAAAVFLRLILPLLLSNSSLFVALSSLQLIVLALLVLSLSLLLNALLLLALTCGLTLLLVRLSSLLILRLALLVLRLPLIIPALRFSLPVLLIVLITAAAPATFVLRLGGLSGLGVPLLLFCFLLCSLSLTVLTALRLLSVRDATRAWHKHSRQGRGQRDAIKVITFHD
jgi:hypothetical protein